jgi:hypothetical protein
MNDKVPDGFKRVMPPPPDFSDEVLEGIFNAVYGERTWGNPNFETETTAFLRGYEVGRGVTDLTALRDTAIYYRRNK